MDLFDVVRSCVRRWYVVLPLLLIAGWAAHHVYTSAKPVYYSNAVVSIAPPNSRLDQSEAGVPVPRNGLLDVGGATLITNLAVLGLREPSVVGQVVAAGGKADYTARIFPVPATSPELPLIMIEATEADPIDASKTVALAAAQANSALVTLQQQAGVPDDQMVKGILASPPSAPALGMPSRTRSTIAIFIAGIGIIVLAGVLVDLMMLRWTARRRDRGQASISTSARPSTPDDENRVGETRSTPATSKHASDEVAADGR